MNTHRPHFSARLWLCPALLLAFSRCTVEQDRIRSAGGTSPDPSGIVRGSVLYRGPQPSCDYQGDAPIRVRGRVVLTLFTFDNPPPPEGRAARPDNVLFLNGDRLFALTDCAPEGSSPDARASISRTAAFSWPELTLADAPRVLQLRGFFDADENMNPFFTVTRVPSAGDVIGAALADDGQDMRPITLPARADALDGYLGEGVLVTLAATVHSEPPRFQLGAERTLSAEATLPMAFDAAAIAADPLVCIDAPSTCVDRTRLLADIRALTCDEPDDECGFSLESLRAAEVAGAFRAAGLTADLSRAGSAYHTSPIDLLTVRAGALDLAQPDGLADPHPILGALADVPWHAPLLVLRRRALDAEQAARERAAGVPEVSLLGSPLLDESGTLPARSVYVGSVPMAVPPVALVDLDPSRSDCRVPYLPAGNLKGTYEGRVVHCGELPTGLYEASVIAGVAGGEPVDDPRSDLGFSYQGAVLSGQAWQVPNELADPAQVGGAHTLAQQGPDALFVVHDPRPTRAGDCSRAVDEVSAAFDDDPALQPVVLRGLCDARPAVRELASGLDLPSCLPTDCCDAVRHLCGLPLCPLCDEDSCPALFEAGLNVRSGPTSVDGPDGAGRLVPDCLPFELPGQCCD